MKKTILSFIAAFAITAPLPAQNLSDFLRGQDSGAYVEESKGIAGEDINTIIRGQNSIHGNCNPLWIVDGVELIGDLNYINPFDVRSIEVIKDISALSKYGSRGANGVIVVTTGQKGANDFNVFWDSGISVGKRFSHIHNLSLNGKTGKTRYGISAYYSNLAGESKVNNSSRGGLRANIEAEVNKVVSFGTNTAVSIGDVTFPVEMALDEDESVMRRVTNSTWMKFNIARNLDLKASIGLDYSNKNQFLWSDAGEGSASIYSTNLLRISPEINVNWFRYFAENNRVSLNGGFDLRDDLPVHGAMSGSGFFTKKLKARGIEFAQSDPYIRKSHMSYLDLGGYLSAGYEFKNIVGISGTARLDRAPRYDTKARLYKSAEGYFDLRNLAFPSSKVVSSLRLKAGWGDAGMDCRGIYPIAVEEGLEPFYEGLVRNRTQELTAGLVVDLFSGRAKVNATYYQRLSADSNLGFCFAQKGEHYYARTDTPENTYSSRSIIANEGVEADLSVDIIRKEKIRWNVAASAAYNFNQVVSLDPQDRSLAVLGFPVDVTYSYDKDVTGDGIVDEYDVFPEGKYLPNVYGAASTFFSFGRFEFDARATFCAGSSIMADHIRLNRASLTYNFLLPETSALKNLAVKAGYSDILTKSFVMGVSLKF